MKKIFNYIMFSVFMFVMFTTNIQAYSYEITSKSIYAGEYVTLTIDASNDIGKFDITSSNTNIITIESGSRWLEKERATFKVTAKKAGSANITITPTDVSTSEGKEVTNPKVISITVTNKPAPQKPVRIPKSSNNYLTSLTVDDYSLDSDFDKEKLEYSVTVKPFTKSIKINAQKENDKANVSGVGEVNLNDGDNKFSIVVTAENNVKRTYVLNVNVPVLKDIEVEVDNKKYTIVREEGKLDLIEGYTKKNISIDNEEDVLSFYSDVTKFQLVILKDNDGNMDYYIYDNGKYTKYKEYDFSSVRICILDNNNIDKDKYVKTDLTIGEDKINAYKLKLKSKSNTTYALDDKYLDYYIIYGINVKTGNKGYYLYDRKENSAIRYDEGLLINEVSTLSNNDNYKTYFYISLMVFGVVILTIGIVLIVKGRKNKNKINFK